MTFIFSAVWAQHPAPKQAPPAEQAPPEEDENLQTPKEYSFNPLAAQKELRIGNFYFTKKSYKAAAGRFREALKWNPTFAEAYVRLGDAEVKLKHLQAAREAYSTYLEMAPGSKLAATVRRKLASLPPPTPASKPPAASESKPSAPPK